MKKIYLLLSLFLGLNLLSQAQNYTVYNDYDQDNGSYVCTYTVTCTCSASNGTQDIDFRAQVAEITHDSYHNFSFALPKGYHVTSYGFSASCPYFDESNLPVSGDDDVYPGNCYDQSDGNTNWDPNYPGKNDYNIYAYVYSDEDKLGKKHNANTKITSTSDNTTSIDENNINLQSVVVYPNPTTGEVTLKYKTPVDVLVYNIVGEVVYKENQVNTVNIGSLDKGIYTFKITTGKDVTFQKIILAK